MQKFFTDSVTTQCGTRRFFKVSN